MQGDLNSNSGMMLHGFRLFWEGTAAIWFDGLPEATQNGTDLIKAAFEARFQPHDKFRWQRVEKFTTRKQAVGESVEQFIADVQRQATKLNKTVHETWISFKYFF